MRRPKIKNKKKKEKEENLSLFFSFLVGYGARFPGSLSKSYFPDPGIRFLYRINERKYQSSKQDARARASRSRGKTNARENTVVFQDESLPRPPPRYFHLRPVDVSGADSRIREQIASARLLIASTVQSARSNCATIIACVRTYRGFESSRIPARPDSIAKTHTRV